jgi:hypothetical protein
MASILDLGENHLEFIRFEGWYKKGRLYEIVVLGNYIFGIYFQPCIQPQPFAFLIGQDGLTIRFYFSENSSVENLVMDENQFLNIFFSLKYGAVPPDAAILTSNCLKLTYIEESTVGM